MARRLAGESAPPPPPPGELPSSAAQANAHFVTQFTSAYNPTGPSSSTNCGPASVAKAHPCQAQEESLLAEPE